MAKPMLLPTPLLRRNPKLSKRDFGHLLIIAGSPSMLGACALSSLAAMCSGAGLVTAAVPKNCNLTLQKKIAHVVMTLPLAQTVKGNFSFKASEYLKKVWNQFDAFAIGPGIGREESTMKLARWVILNCPKPLLIDADALYALIGWTDILKKAKGVRILTPHVGEMSRLVRYEIPEDDKQRRLLVLDFAKKNKCILLLKGQHTVIASAHGDFYLNRTGNVGMATAGSGDVLTGMITAFLGQGIEPFQSACLGAYYHGKAGDRAVKEGSKISLIATDLVEKIPQVFKS